MFIFTTFKLKHLKHCCSSTRPSRIMSTYRPRCNSSHSSSRNIDHTEWENVSSRQSTNRFLGSIAYLAEKHGYNPDDILASAHHFSSADFCVDKHFNNDPERYLPSTIITDLRARYNLKSNGPFITVPSERSLQKRVASRNQWTVYVPNKFTDQLVADDIILETFDQSQRLYQYLNWTIRISTMARTMALLQGQNKYTVMLCHTELHDRRGRDLYALCIQNDVVSSNAQEWYGNVSNVALSEFECGSMCAFHLLCVHFTY